MERNQCVWEEKVSRKNITQLHRKKGEVNWEKYYISNTLSLLYNISFHRLLGSSQQCRTKNTDPLVYMRHLPISRPQGQQRRIRPNECLHLAELLWAWT